MKPKASASLRFSSKVHLAHALHPVQIGARAEHLAVTASTTAPHRGVGVELAEGRRELGDHVSLNAFADLGPDVDREKESMAYSTIEIHTERGRRRALAQPARGPQRVQRDHDRRAHGGLQRARRRRLGARGRARGHGKVFLRGRRSELDEAHGEMDFEENRKDALAFGSCSRAPYAQEADNRAVCTAPPSPGHGLDRRVRHGGGVDRDRVRGVRGEAGARAGDHQPLRSRRHGRARRRDGIFLTAERFSAAEAYRVGFVQEIAQPDELDATVNASSANRPGRARSHAVTKDLIRSVARRPLSSELLKTWPLASPPPARPKKQGGVRSFLEKRAPAWVKVAKQAARSKKRK